MNQEIQDILKKINKSEVDQVSPQVPDENSDNDSKSLDLQDAALLPENSGTINLINDIDPDLINSQIDQPEQFIDLSNIPSSEEEKSKSISIDLTPPISDHPQPQFLPRHRPLRQTKTKKIKWPWPFSHKKNKRTDDARRTERYIERKLRIAENRRIRLAKQNNSILFFFITTAIFTNTFLAISQSQDTKDFLQKNGISIFGNSKSEQTIDKEIADANSSCADKPEADGCFSSNVIRQGTIICGSNIHPLALEFASTPLRAKIGLSYRKELPSSTGFITVFENPSVINFITKDISFAIDLISFDRDGQFKAIKKEISGGQQMPIQIAPSTGLLALKAGEVSRLSITPECRLHLFENGVPASMFEGEQNIQ